MFCSLYRLFDESLAVSCGAFDLIIWSFAFVNEKQTTRFLTQAEIIL